MPSRIFVILLIAACLTMSVGCSENAQSPPDAPATEPSAAVPAKAGAQLWAENCTRCHNSRPPDSYSQAQWQTVVHHMRLRANLTGEEARKITEFLQSAS
jgi:cytochrome c5